MEDLSGQGNDADTLYLRYTFSKSILKMSFSPGWDTYQQPWSAQDGKLTIGFDTYNIEELTDTSLIISLAGFRRIRFLAEDFLSTQSKYLDSIGMHNNKVLYKANQFITPRYTGKTQFRDFIQNGGAKKYNIKKANYFLVTFIITESGKMENIKVVKGISEGFDKEIIKQLAKTEKFWQPAFFNGIPIQTEMFYDIKYLDSFLPYETGTLQ